MASFPKGKFDDQCDSTSQALDWLKNGYNSNGFMTRRCLTFTNLYLLESHLMLFFETISWNMFIRMLYCAMRLA